MAMHSDYGREARDGADILMAEVNALAVRNTPTLRTLRRARSAAWRGQPPEFILGVATEMQRRRAHRWLGYELIRRHHAAFDLLNDRSLGELSVDLDSWDVVDAFARVLSGPAWARGLASDALIDSWAGSADRWLRRTALVSTVALNTPADGGRGDPDRTLAVCRRMAGDRDDMVEKALSWALRVLAVRDGAAVRQFLAAEEPRLAARVKREVRHKLETGLKNPRRAG
jgi:3-methyladenine DNA glycosylase AlkD